MNRLFLQSVMWRGNYVLSPFTSASYYAKSLEGNFQLTNDSERRRAMKDGVRNLVESGEEWLLPHRVGILVGESMASVSGSGRSGKRMDAQLKGAFTLAEQSPYKVNKPFQVQTGLWRCEGERSIYYGSIGISGVSGKVQEDNGDLIIVRTSDWRKLEVFIFRGLAGTQKHLDFLPEVVEFVKGL